MRPLGQISEGENNIGKSRLLILFYFFIQVKEDGSIVATLLSKGVKVCFMYGLQFYFQREKWWSGGGVKSFSHNGHLFWMNLSTSQRSVASVCGMKWEIKKKQCRLCFYLPRIPPPLPRIPSHLIEDVLINHILCSSQPKWLKTVVKMEKTMHYSIGHQCCRNFLTWLAQG